MLERLYIGNMPMVHTETVKVSADEKKLLKRLRNADSDIRELFIDMSEKNTNKKNIFTC